jgi:Piwi domain
MMQPLSFREGEPILLTEIFRIELDPVVQGFYVQLVPELDRQLGNRLCFQLSRYDPERIYIWDGGRVIYIPKLECPSQEPNTPALTTALAAATAQLEEDNITDLTIEASDQLTLSAGQIAQLGCQIFRQAKIPKIFPIGQHGRVRVQRHMDARPEKFCWNDSESGAIALTSSAKMRYTGTLRDLLYPTSQNLSVFSSAADLIGLRVNAFGVNGGCTIHSHKGTLGEHRDRLLRLASDAEIGRIITQSDDHDLVVAVQIGKGRKLYDYPITALTPSITATTAKQFGENYGELLKLTKRNLLQERIKALQDTQNSLNSELKIYGLALSKSINNKQQPGAFWQLDSNLDDTILRFGNGQTSLQGKTLSGLSAGGAYHVNNPVIRISTLRFFPDSKLVNPFVNSLKARLEKYQFTTSFVYRHKPNIALNFQDLASVKIHVEQVLNEALDLPCDIFLIFLPDADRELDDTEGGSLYHFLYSRILQRGIATQFIYEKTLKQQLQSVLNNVVPGIIAKTGNIPFVFQEPLSLADRFIGLDVARKALTKRSGSINACATIRIYGRWGDLIEYALEDSNLEGEEIPQRVIDKALPIDSTSKVTLIYRDGHFCGNEAQALRDRANRLNAGLILVECIKSGAPRIYRSWKPPEPNRAFSYSAPNKGVAVHLSPYEALVISTQVSESIGIPQPLRLNVHQLSDSVDLNHIIETTLKLTLLHYGSLKPPRLPIPIFGADRVSGLRLNGIYPVMAIHEKRQFWL